MKKIKNQQGVYKNICKHIDKMKENFKEDIIVWEIIIIFG